eukprot:IDg13551t1
MKLSSAAKEPIWINRMALFVEAHEHNFPIKIFADNQYAIKMSRNDSSGTRKKHINIQFHFARNSLSKGLYEIYFCPTVEMRADILTKPLQRILLERHRTYVGVCSVGIY